jgi:hypothetical protein
MKKCVCKLHLVKKEGATNLRGTVLQHHLHACGVLALECLSTLEEQACLSRPKMGIETGGGLPSQQEQSSLRSFGFGFLSAGSEGGGRRSLAPRVLDLHRLVSVHVGRGILLKLRTHFGGHDGKGVPRWSVSRNVVCVGKKTTPVGKKPDTCGQKPDTCGQKL